MNEDNKILNSFSVVGLVLGILSVLFFWLFGFLPILAIIFSAIALHSIKIKKQKGKGLAIAGLVLGIVFILLFGLQVFLSYNNYFQTENIQDNIVQEKNNLLDLLQGNWECSTTRLDTTTYHKLTVTNTFINEIHISLSSSYKNNNTGYITLLDNENFSITFDTGVTQNFRYDKNLNTIIAMNGTGMIFTKIK